MINKPIITFQKNADKVLNRVVIPKKWIELFGRQFYMQVDYENERIILTPFKERSK